MDLVIFRGTVPERWPQGVSLVFDLPIDSDLVPVLDLEAVEALPSTAPDPILDGVDLAGVRWDQAVRVAPEDGFEALASAGSLPLLLRDEAPGREVYIFTPMLVGGNFTKHPAFPILLANLVEQARPFAPQPAYPAGEDFEAGQLLEGQSPELTLPDGDTQKLSPNESFVLVEPGLYKLTSTDKYGQPVEAVFGVNQGDLAESDITPRDWRIGYIEDLKETAGEEQQIDVALGPWLLAVAVVFLVLEAWRAWR